MARFPSDIDMVMEGIRDAVRPFRKAVFGLADGGCCTLSSRLLGWMISVRKRDEVSLPISIRLVGAEPTAEAVAALSVAEIDALITPSTSSAESR